MSGPPPATTSKPLLKSKARLIQKWSCDRVVRFTPKGARGTMSYSDAYEFVFEREGGRIENKGAKDERRIHTVGSVRCLAALNQLYLGRPDVRQWLQDEYVLYQLKKEQEKPAEAVKA